MDTLNYIISKYNLKIDGSMPVEIPNVQRGDLANWLRELDFKIGVEVGVASGQYSKVLCNSNPQMKIYGVDPWASYREYKDYVKKETFSLLYEEARKRLLNRPNYEFIKDFSMNAVKRFENNSIDFCYIDANHQEPYITQDIVEWGKRVRIGGILAGHDFIKPKQNNCDVIQAMMRYTQENNINPWFVLGLNGKIPGLARDGVRSWMIIKQ